MRTRQTLAVVHLSALMLAFGAACKDTRTPTAPDPVGLEIIAGVTTTASAPRISEPDRFTYRMSATLRSPDLGANLSRVTVTVSEMARVATVSHLGVVDAFGTTRIPANGTLTSTGIAAVGPLRPTGKLTVRVMFVDDNGNTGSAETTVGVKFDVTGRWSGPLQVGAGSPSVARATVAQNGDEIIGELISGDGVLFSLNGSVSRNWAPGIFMRGPEGSCSATLQIHEVEFVSAQPVRLSGRPIGRCFGTISGSFDFRRG